MRLSANDYKNIITTRVNKINQMLYPQQYGQPAVAGWQGNNNGEPHDNVPNFDTIRQLVSEIQELAEEYETSIGPA